MHELRTVEQLQLQECCRAAIVALIPDLRDVAWDHGYALALHGSVRRDLDLLAVPWIDWATGPEALVWALRDASRGFVRVCADGTLEATTKPHGRLAYTIVLFDQFGPIWRHGEVTGRHPNTFIDLSVMPKSKQ